MIRQASREDLEDLEIILNQAVRRLKENQIDQWQRGYPSRADLKEDLDDGVLYVCGKKPKAFAAMIAGIEPTYHVIENGQWLQSGPYLTIHRLAVGDKWLRTGCAKELLEYAAQMAYQKGLYALRIDTHPDNQAMIKLIAKCGFQYCGIIYVQDGTRRFAYEKKVNKDGF